MPYAVMDDEFHSHPKILRGGPIVELIQLRAIAYCNRYLTDGVIHPEVVPVLMLGLERLEIDGTPTPNIDWVAKLLELGLWERHDRGYLVHDFLAFNKPRAVVLAIKDQKRRAGVAGGQASAQARAQAPGQPDGQAGASPSASIQAQPQAGAQAGAQAKSNPLTRSLHLHKHYPAQAPAQAPACPSASNGDNSHDPAPTDEEVRALIRATAAKLGTPPPDSTHTPTPIRIRTMLEARRTAQPQPAQADAPEPQHEEPPF